MTSGEGNGSSVAESGGSPPAAAKSDRLSLTGWELLSDAQRADIAAHIDGLTIADTKAYEPPRPGWTCFHCGETFKTRGGARLHFGEAVTGRPTCCDLAAAERVICDTVQVRWARDPGGGGGYVIDEASARKAAAEIARLSSETPASGSEAEGDEGNPATDDQQTDPSTLAREAGE